MRLKFLAASRRDTALSESINVDVYTVVHTRRRRHCFTPPLPCRSGRSRSIAAVVSDVTTRVRRDTRALRQIDTVESIGGRPGLRRNDPTQAVQRRWSVSVRREGTNDERRVRPSHSKRRNPSPRRSLSCSEMACLVATMACLAATRRRSNDRQGRAMSKNVGSHWALVQVSRLCRRV